MESERPIIIKSESEQILDIINNPPVLDCEVLNNQLTKFVK